MQQKNSVFRLYVFHSMVSQVNSFEAVFTEDWELRVEDQGFKTEDWGLTTDDWRLTTYLMRLTFTIPHICHRLKKILDWTQKNAYFALLGGYLLYFLVVFIVFGCKTLRFKNPAFVKEMTNMIYDFHPLRPSRSSEILTNWKSTLKLLCSFEQVVPAWNGRWKI